MERKVTQTPLIREVSVWDWVNWNQHPWLDTQAEASWQHVSCQHQSLFKDCPGGREGSLLRSGKGLHGCHEFTEQEITGASLTAEVICAHASALLCKDNGYMDQRQLGAFSPSQDWTGFAALSPPSRLPMGRSLMVAAPQSHASPQSNSGTTLAQGCTH